MLERPSHREQSNDCWTLDSCDFVSLTSLYFFLLFMKTKLCNNSFLRLWVKPESDLRVTGQLAIHVENTGLKSLMLLNLRLIILYLLTLLKHILGKCSTKF